MRAIGWWLSELMVRNAMSRNAMAQRSTAYKEKGLHGKVRPDRDVARWLSTDYKQQLSLT